uniref:Peptidase S1 domain-containing protein n=1 Tax=Anopheles farauti TaxID=69004 RepID=A0A182PZJ0_9DIPT
MKKVSLPVLPKKECIRMLRYAGLGPRFNLREGFMCAGGEADVDMCKGDGGSPLACESESGSFVLAGIVSWGIGCGGDSLPGVHIKPICLPQPTDDFVGRRCISNGWGTVKGVYASIMKKVSLPVLPKKECIRMLRYAGLGPRFNLREGFMCAGGEADVDMCKGDGGSPLACESESGSFVLAGIVSWGIGCGGDSLPGVYVEVSKYLDWINDHLQFS